MIDLHGTNRIKGFKMSKLIKKFVSSDIYVFSCEKCGHVQQYNGITKDGRNRVDRLHKKVCKGKNDYACQKIKNTLQDIVNNNKYIKEPFV